MNWLDIVIAIIIAASAFSGAARGLTRMVIGIAATIAGVLCACWFYGSAGSFLIPFVSTKSVANFLGFLIVFGLILLAGALISKLLATLFKWVGLSWLDRLGGLAFGAVRGVLVAVVLLMAMTAFTPDPPPKAVAQSSMAPYIIEASGVLSMAAPKELTDGFRGGYDKLKRFWADTLKKSAGRLPPQEL